MKMQRLGMLVKCFLNLLLVFGECKAKFAQYMYINLQMVTIVTPVHAHLV